MAFFDRHPEHVRNLVLQRYPERCAREMVEHLHTFDVHASEDDVRRFRRKNGMKSGWHYVVPPADTQDERVGQYVEALRNYGGNVFSNRVLGLKGGCWACCAHRLRDADLITRYDERRPAKYVRLVSDDVIAAWYTREVMGGK